MSENLITDLKGQKNLPRWFPSIFNMIKNPDQGRLVIELADGRKFLSIHVLLVTSDNCWQMIKCVLSVTWV